MSTSFDEGYGISVQEAVRYGLHIACSDIPIFRELCGSVACYLPLDDERAAAAMLAALIGAVKAEGGTRQTNPTAAALTTWRDSANCLHRLIADYQQTGAFGPT